MRMGKWMEVHCTYTDYDGENYGQANHVIKIYQKRLFAAETHARLQDCRPFPSRGWRGGKSSRKDSLREARDFSVSKEFMSEVITGWRGTQRNRLGLFTIQI